MHAITSTDACSRSVYLRHASCVFSIRLRPVLPFAITYLRHAIFAFAIKPGEAS